MVTQYYLITGASSGIGFALSSHLAELGKHVIIVARSHEPLLQLKQQYPENILPITADLGTQAGRDQICSRISGLGNIAGLVNNAAAVEPVSLLSEIDIAAWHQQMAINIDAPMFLTQALLPNFSHGSRIINLTTGATNYAPTGIASYAMTKAALNVYTKYLSVELQSQKILVTAAHPGVVKTKMVQDLIDSTKTDLDIYAAQQRFIDENLYLDVETTTRFLSWLLLDAKSDLYVGDIIGIYNEKYHPYWCDKKLPSPYPEGVKAP